MEHTNKNSLCELIDAQLDDLGKKILRFCSIPSFFTRHLMQLCLPKLCSEEISESYINCFLSLPFILKRNTRIGNNNFEYFTIHSLAKQAFSLSTQEYKMYGTVLVEYFDAICATSPISLSEKYFFEKLLCELKMGHQTTWRDAYQAAMELNRLQECDKLMELLRVSNEDGLGEWNPYYEFVNRYINGESAKILIPEIEELLSTAKIKNTECVCYFQNLLAVLYDIMGRWHDAKSIYLHILDAFQPDRIAVQEILLTAHLGLTTVCCRLNDLNTAGKYMNRIFSPTSRTNLGMQIAAYRAAGLYANKSCRWEYAYEVYQKALSLMKEQQAHGAHGLVQIYTEYRPCPVYRPDEIGIYSRLGEILLLQGKFQSSLEYHQKELQAQQIAKNETGIAWAKYNIGRLQYLSGNTSSSQKMFQDSISRFQQTDNEKNCAYPLGELSYAYQYDGKPELSLVCLEKSTNILSQSEDFEQCFFYFSHLGRICQAQGFLDFAKQVFELCLSYYEMHPTLSNYGWLLNNYARNFMYSNDYQRAEDFFQRALECFTRTNNKRGTAYLYNNFAELYVKTGKVPEAQELFCQSLSMKQEMGDLHAICYTHRELGELYLYLCELGKARYHLEKAEEIGFEGNYIMLQGDIMLSWGKLMEYQGKYSEAMKCFKVALENYEHQNFLSRKVNCCQKECALAEKVSDIQLYSALCDTITEAIVRKRHEELLMLDKIGPLMKRIKDLIS